MTLNTSIVTSFKYYHDHWGYSYQSINTLFHHLDQVILGIYLTQGVGASIRGVISNKYRRGY